ncbi:HNH endonuclease signature motif containing protein [Actinomycetospora chiangmaiensis]|uniref:HNH endonuclease signature motif containing protein n=1 Tax=Actinomycetospora chiangmaiensis TaxID=402650 RepID=UPI0003A1B81C|nr:HNH endonuclease signature motif containing protein [Actinomycetospora chiangmaiensis]
MTTAVDPERGHDEAAPRPHVGPEGLPGQWVDAGLSVQFALSNVAAWQLCRWVLECSRAKAGTAERVASRPRAGKAVAASLGWSESYGASRIEFARQVLERLPRLGAAMQAGVLEERKASSVVDLVADLDDAQARAVVEEVLEQAPSLGYTELRRLVGRVAMAVDPGWAERRRAAAVARRRVALRSAPSGAAELCGLDLPEDPAQDAHDRIVALAHAVLRRLTRAGITSVSVGTAESEVMLTLTGPAGAGMYDLDVVKYVTTLLGGPASEPDDGLGPDDGPDDVPDDDPGPDDGPGLDGSDDVPDEGSDEGPDRGRPGRGATSEPGAAPAGGPVARNADRRRAAVAFRPRTVVRLELRAVIGCDHSPGESPGRGPLTHPAALAMAWARTHGRWRIRLYDEHGELEHVLSIRPPRGGPPPVGGRRRAQVVELTAHTHELDALATAYTVDRVRAGVVPDPGADALDLLRRARRALDHERGRPPREHPALTRAEASHRFPSTRLRDWVQSRDHTCRAPGCAVDALGTDLDHTVPVTAGGRTAADDLGALCRRDHLLKGDPDSGWTLRQPRPGHFEWTSPTGRVHTVLPHRYRPMPSPVARTGSRGRLRDHGSMTPPRPGAPRPNRHGQITDAATDTAWHLVTRADRTGYATADPPF